MEKTGNAQNPLDIQVGGDHYKRFKIQPIEFITVNGFGFIQGCVIKRMARYNVDGGKGIQDLEKARHEIDILIEIEKRNIISGSGPDNNQIKKGSCYGQYPNKLDICLRCVGIIACTNMCKSLTKAWGKNDHTERGI